MRIPRLEERAVSDVIATVLIVAIVVVIMVSAAFIIDTQLPGTGESSATVMGNNVSLHFSPNGAAGYLAGSIVYESGPVLASANAQFLVIFGGKTYSYSISSFKYAGDTWTNITGGTTVIINTSLMPDSGNQVIPLLTSGENYTMEFLTKGSVVWRYEGKALPSSAVPVIAYSWFAPQGGSGSNINVYVAVYGNSSVSVSGNFSALYGSHYSSWGFSQSSSPGVYYSGLPAPPFAGYYEITASSYGYHTDEWFYLNWTTSQTGSSTVPKNDSLNIYFNNIPSDYLNRHGVVVEVTNPATATTFAPAFTSTNQYAWYGTWLTLTSNESFNDSALQGTSQAVVIQLSFPSWLRVYSMEGPVGSGMTMLNGNSLSGGNPVDYVTFSVLKDASTNVFINFSLVRSISVQFSGFPSWGRWNGSLYMNGTVQISPDSFTMAAFSDFQNVTWTPGVYTVGFAITALNTHQTFTVYYVGGDMINANHNVTILVNATSPWVRYYDVNFYEEGLPSGTAWSVTFAGAVVSSTGDKIEYSDPNGSYQWSLGVISGYRPAQSSGTTVIDGNNITITTVWSLVKYNETFTESGLPAGTRWSVNVGGTDYSSSTGVVDAELPNATYSWGLLIVPGWIGSPSSGSVTVNGAGGNVAITFVRALYNVSFVESGLNSGALWNVTFNGTEKSTTGGEISFSVPNGTYAFSVGKRYGWSISPVQGDINMNGASVVETITFVAIPVYSVTFEESGIAPGVRWYVNLTNVSSNGMNASSAVVSSSTPWSSSVSFSEFDGQYSYTTFSNGFIADGWSSSSPITVSGSNVVIKVTFRLVTYSMWFVPEGLGNPTSWSVDLNVNGNNEVGSGTYSSSSNGSVRFAVGNGSYSYQVPELNGWRAVVPSGTVSVNGVEVTVDVVFVRVAYTIWFNATGLLPGERWYVNVSSGSFSGTSSSIAISEYDGRYNYTTSANGYVANPNSGGFTVNGADQSIGITFTPVVVFVPHGLASNTQWSVSVSEQSWPYNNYYDTGTGNLSFTGLSGSYSYSVTSSITLGSGYRYSLLSTSPASPIDVNGPVVVNVYYAEQVYVTASSAYYNTYLWGDYNGQIEGPYSGSGWFDVGSSVYATSQEAFYGNQYMSSGVVTSLQLVNQPLDFGGQTYSGYPNWWFNNPQGNFVMMFYGAVYVQQAGWYTIGTASDDGSAVWSVGPNINVYDWNSLSVDNWYQQGATFRSGGQTYLSQGYNYMVVIYEQGNGGYALNLQWQPSGQSWQEMPVTGTAYIYDAPFASSSTGTVYSPSANGGNPTSETFYDPSFWNTQSITSPESVSATWVSDYYYVSSAASPSVGGSVSPGSGWYQYGQYVPISASPANGYQFSSWSASGNWGGYLGQNGYIYVYGMVSLTALFSATLTFVPEGLPSGTYWQVYSNQWGWQGGTGNIVFTGQSGLVSYQVSSPIWTYDSVTNQYEYYYARPSSGTVQVNGPATVYINWVVPQWTVWFNETGLSSGTGWSVTINGNTYSSSSDSIAVSLYYGNYYYTVNSPSGYSTNNQNGNVYVNGGNQVVNIQFLTDLTFVPEGLPANTYWQVYSNEWGWQGGYGNIVFTGQSGQVYYQPENPIYAYFSTTGQNTYFYATPSSGYVTMNGPQTVYIHYSVPMYTVTFSETGLASGTSWSVNVNGQGQSSTSSSITFTLYDGSYTYTLGVPNGYSVYGGVTSSGVYVNGGNQVVNVQFLTDLTFVPEGLPSGTYWQVYSNQWGWQGGTGNIVFTGQSGQVYYQVENPVYAYFLTIGQNTYFYATPSSGYVTMNGPQTVYIHYSVPMYTVTFSETGLASGTYWSVTLNGQNQGSTSSTITFNMYDGNYYYTVNSPSGYADQYSTNGYVYVSGSSVVENEQFIGVVWFIPEGLPYYTSWNFWVSNWGGYSGYYYPGGNGSVQIQVPMGYTFTVYTAASYYIPNPSSGTISQPGDIYIYFHAPQYPVYFNETGFSTGTWSVSMNGYVQTTTGSSLVFWENPGAQYSYSISAAGYQVSPSSGYVYVSNYPQTVFVSMRAAIVFIGTGDVPQNWEIHLSNYGYYSGSGNLTIVPWSGYGSYSYSVMSPTGGYDSNFNQWVTYYATPTSGSFYFGGPTAIYINWYVPTFTVTFTENGLPGGTQWGVTLNGVYQGTASSSISFQMPDGNYYYYDSANGYSFAPSSGYVYVNGANQVVSLNVLLGAVWFYPSGLYGGVEYYSQGTSWSINVGGYVFNGFYGWERHARYDWWLHRWFVYWSYQNGSIYVGPYYGFGLGEGYSVYSAYNGFTGQYYYPNPSSGNIYSGSVYINFYT